MVVRSAVTGRRVSVQARRHGERRHCERRPVTARSRAWVGSRSPMGWWFGLAPANLEFWIRFSNERNQGKQAHPVLKYPVPHGSQPSLGSSSLVAHVLHYPPPPNANSFVIGTAVINAHTSGDQLGFLWSRPCR
jgi:hypothetical protein